MFRNRKIVFVAGARTPVGKYSGSLAAVPNHVAGAHALMAAANRAGIGVDEIEELVVGCVGQVGGDAFLARRIALEAGMPTTSTAMTVNRLCGSGLQAIYDAALELEMGESKIVAAGGSENMSGQPFLDYQARNGWRLGDHTLVDGTLSLVTDPFAGAPMGVSAENVARRYHVSRTEQDEFAAESQKRAAEAQDAGYLQPEIAPITIKERKTVREFAADEHIRSNTTVESLGKLRTAFATDDEATVTAGNSSGINDGAAFLIMTTEEEALERGLPILGELVDFQKVGIEPEIMGYAPKLAIEKILSRNDLEVSDLDWVELNEAFASQAVAVIRDAGLDPAKTNPLGGAIALGHPVGATGAILTLRTLLQLKRTGGETGLVSMCIGGGQGVAAIVRVMK